MRMAPIDIDWLGGCCAFHSFILGPPSHVRISLDKRQMTKRQENMGLKEPLEAKREKIKIRYLDYV